MKRSLTGGELQEKEAGVNTGHRKVGGVGFGVWRASKFGSMTTIKVGSVL